MNIIDLMISDSNIVLCMEVGATIKNEDAKDVDFIVVVKNIEKFKKLLSNKFFNVVNIDDSYRVLDSKINLNFAVFLEGKLEEKVQSYGIRSAPLGEKREWVLGYWIPEIFLQDIYSAKIIIGTQKDVYKFQKLVKDNKKNILNNYKQKIEDEITIKSKMLMEEPVNFKQNILKDDLVLALVRYIQISIDGRYYNFSKLINEQIHFINYIMTFDGRDFLKVISRILGCVSMENYYDIDFWNLEA